MIKKHIETLEIEINATGKRLENEELSADELVAIGHRMAELGGTLNWLRAVNVKDMPKVMSLGNGKQIIH